MIPPRQAREILKPAEFARRARAIRLAAFDVDGILTDGRLTLDDQGRESKAFHVRDGQGLKLLQRDGVELALITGRRSRIVELRAAELGITHLIQGADDKLDAWLALLQRLGVAAEHCTYMGDDLPDLPVLRRCGLAFTVPEAPDIVRNQAHQVTQAPGGNGAVREFCEAILRARGSLDVTMAPWLR